MPVITLTTDFGASPYVAAMKGVIISINSKVHIIDVTHAVSPQCVLEGAYVMDSMVTHFRSTDTVHVGVVDPGVGSDRRCLLFDCEGGSLVGPDNGLLATAAENLGARAVYEITNREWMHGAPSPTFHGRDIFAPAAARLSLGDAPGDAGPKVTEWRTVDIAEHERVEGGIMARVVHVDHFGNIVTSIPSVAVPSETKEVSFRLPGKGGQYGKVPFVRTYSEAALRSIVCLVNSHGHLEIAMNGGNAAAAMGAVPEDEVLLGL